MLCFDAGTAEENRQYFDGEVDYGDHNYAIIKAQSLLHSNMLNTYLVSDQNDKYDQNKNSDHMSELVCKYE